MSRPLVWVLGIVAVSVCVSANAAVVTDGDFANWSSFSFVTDDVFVPSPGPGTSTGSTSRSTTGGNPDAHLAGTDTIRYGDFIWFGGIKDDYVYDPGSRGAILDIYVGADLLHPGAGATAWQLVILQGGTRYYSYPWTLFTFSPLWQAVSLTGLTASDFDTNPSAGYGAATPDGISPDFSIAGDPISIGFMFGNGLSGPGTVPNSVRLDNLVVQLNSASDVPSPPVLALIAPFLALMLRRSRRGESEVRVKRERKRKI